MKESITAETKIAKEAKETVQECVSEFISFITCEASEKCKNEKRKTINGDDIIFALEMLGFDKYVDILKIYLEKYRKVTDRDRGVGRCGEAAAVCRRLHQRARHGVSRGLERGAVSAL